MENQRPAFAMRTIKSVKKVEHYPIPIGFNLLPIYDYEILPSHYNKMMKKTKKNKGDR